MDIEREELNSNWYIKVLKKSLHNRIIIFYNFLSTRTLLPNEIELMTKHEAFKFVHDSISVFIQQNQYLTDLIFN